MRPSAGNVQLRIPAAEARLGFRQVRRACQFWRCPLSGGPGSPPCLPVPAVPSLWEAGCVGRGRRAATRRRSPAPPHPADAGHPRQPHQLSRVPNPCPGRGVRGPRYKKGAASSGPSGCPHNAPLQSPMASGLPTGGGLGTEALLGGAALPCGRPHRAPLLPGGTPSPSPSTVPTFQSPRGAWTASTTSPAPPWPQWHGPHRSSPWPWHPEPAWAAPSSASALAPARHAPGSPPCLSRHRAPCHWTAPSGRPTPRTRDLGNTGSGGSVSERGPGTEQGAWGQAAGTRMLAAPTSCWTQARPGAHGCVTAVSPELPDAPPQANEGQTLVLTVPEPADTFQVARPCQLQPRAWPRADREPSPQHPIPGQPKPLGLLSGQPGAAHRAGEPQPRWCPRQRDPPLGDTHPSPLPLAC